MQIYHEERNLVKLVKQFSTKAELVYQTLLDDSIENKLTPGTRLIVKEIAERLSVSDIPVREASKMLEATG
jgi:DNA-binding GntR family transcriptional regulator